MSIYILGKSEWDRLGLVEGVSAFLAFKKFWFAMLEPEMILNIAGSVPCLCVSRIGVDHCND